MIQIICFRILHILMIISLSFHSYVARYCTSFHLYIYHYFTQNIHAIFFRLSPLLTPTVNKSPSPQPVTLTQAQTRIANNHIARHHSLQQKPIKPTAPPPPPMTFSPQGQGRGRGSRSATMRYRGSPKEQPPKPPPPPPPPQSGIYADFSLLSMLFLCSFLSWIFVI